MILTEQEISLLAHNIDDGDWNDLNYQKCWHEGFVAGARAIESAVLKKLKAQEPVAYMYDGIRHDGSKHGPHLTWRIDTCDAMSASKGTTMIPLYTNPDPRVAELEAVLRECREVIEEAQTYCEGPQWSPSMAHDCGTAISKIDEVLHGKE